MRPPVLSSVLLVGLFSASAAWADVPAILACADQTDSQARLQCFDREAAKLKKDMQEAQARKFSLFGFQLPFTGGDDSPDTPKEPVLGPKEVNQISANLTGWIKDYTGHVHLTLDNGQTWQVEDTARVPLTQKDGTPVVIVRNLFGGFFMSLNGRDTRLTVTRLR